jgi:hypothetical protein
MDATLYLQKLKESTTEELQQALLNQINDIELIEYEENK